MENITNLIIIKLYQFKKQEYGFFYISKALKWSNKLSLIVLGNDVNYSNSAH